MRLELRIAVANLILLNGIDELSKTKAFKGKLKTKGLQFQEEIEKQLNLIGDKLEENPEAVDLLFRLTDEVEKAMDQIL